MKNLWFSFFTGRILVKVDGKGIERLLNHLVKSNINIWKVKRMKDRSVFFYISLTDLQKLRYVVRQSNCKIYLVRGGGMPFLWKRALNNIGFLIGAFLFLIVIFLLSNVTWSIQISGADPQTEQRIREELHNLGVIVGTFHWTVDKPDIIQKKLTEKIDNITWIGVELKGTTYHFQVVPKTEPEPAKLENPRHLVANKRAVITDMYVEKGEAVVKVNQYVEKGQLLVSGLIGSEENRKVVVAKGEVWGLTWYQTKVEFPLKRNIEVLTGERKNKYYIKFGKKMIPLWGFGSIDYKNFSTETVDHDIFFLGKKLPFSFAQKTTLEKDIQELTYTKEDAIQEAKKLARKDLLMTIPKDAKLDKEIILQETLENGKVNLSINYQVIENIAIEKPIIQGDSKIDGGESDSNH